MICSWGIVALFIPFSLLLRVWAVRLSAAISPVKFAKVSQSVSAVARWNFPTRAPAIIDSAKATKEHASAV